MPLSADTRSLFRTVHETRYPSSSNGEPSVSTYRPDSHPVFSQSAREWTSLELLSSAGSQSMTRCSCMQILRYFSPSKHYSLFAMKRLHVIMVGG